MITITNPVFEIIELGDKLTREHLLSCSLLHEDQSVVILGGIILVRNWMIVSHTKNGTTCIRGNAIRMFEYFFLCTAHINNADDQAE